MDPLKVTGVSYGPRRPNLDRETFSEMPSITTIRRRSPRFYAATSTDAFALDAQTGKTLWSHNLTRNVGGVDTEVVLVAGKTLWS